MIISAVVTVFATDLNILHKLFRHIGLDYIFLDALVGPVLIPHLKVIL